MPLRPSLPWILLALASALIAMVMATSATQKAEAAIAAAVFAVILISAALRTNAPIWRRSASAAIPDVTQRVALLQTTQLVMLAYLWCALAFYSIYLGTSVRWQHGWEYGTAMLAIAVAHAFYLWRLSDPADPVSTPRAVERAVRLSSIQAILIAIGLIWLISSGKLSSLRGDWPANQLFIAGGFVVMFLSAIIIKTYSVLNERQAH